MSGPGFREPPSWAYCTTRHPPTRDPYPAPVAGPLSPGEMRVLRYLPTNLSRQQIAGELSISLNTVNTNFRGIYAKLGVSDRSGAVRRAWELRLLAVGRLASPAIT
jgi:LuxR family transcriptional regulator, maltose regulon positive regulatory protein